MTPYTSEEAEIVRADAGALSQATRLPWVALSRAIPLLCLLASLLIGLSLIATQAYPGAFDELEHVSYAAFLQETGRLLPRFEEQRILIIDDMSRWTARPNYLGHPSPFYVVIGLFLDRTLAPAQAVLAPRLVSAGLLLLGVALALWAGWRHFGQDRAALLTFCVLLALCPKLLEVASQVTNDSLAFLGGALAYWGTSTGERRRWAGAVGVALGLTLALWAKPNAGLAVGAWLGVFALLRAAGRRALLLALACALAIGVVPYLLIIKDYGALVPVTVEQFGNVRQLGGFSSYLPAFLLTIGRTWCFAQTMTWPIPSTVGLGASLLFWAMIACAALGSRLAWRCGRTTGGAIAVAAPLAFALVLPIHLWFAATELGYSLPAASFRYYLPLWPPLAHALAYGVMAARRPWHRLALASVSLAALTVGWVSP